MFSSPTVSYGMFPMLLDGILRYGIAIANDNATSMNVTLASTSNNGGVSKIVPIAAHSQLVGLVDQFLSVPAQGLGALEVVSQSGQQFSMVGLVFDHNVLATLVPSY